MKPIYVNENNSLVPQQALADGIAALQPRVQELRLAAEQEYQTIFAALNAPLDTQTIEQIGHLVQKKKQLGVTAIIVIGIGGSNLGAKAVWQACGVPTSGLQVLWVDTVDTDTIFAQLAQVKQILQQGNTVIINAISKSGTTTETIANFECFLALIKQYRPDNFADFVVITTDKNSKLWQLAQKQNFACLEIPAHVGGRFSVLTAVGLFPLMFLGIDCPQLLAGAKQMRTQCLQDGLHNPAALSAVTMWQWYTQGFTVHNLFLFAPAWEDMGKWYRQLVGESLGKEYDRDGKKVNVGITPMVSIGSTDLHSVGQLYLSGPYNTATTFVIIEKNNHQVLVPDYPEYDSLVANIQNKSLDSIMDAIFNGVVHAYGQQKRPSMVLTIPEKSAFYCGQFLQYKMIEIMYLGYLLQVDPFDQPHVELYKKRTREILDNI